MPLADLSHFSALLIFAGFVSLAIGFLARRTAARRIQHALWSFALFVVVSIAIAWLMYPFTR